MGTVTQLWDRLTNIVTGMGTTVDKRTAGYYAFVPVTGAEAEAGYRTSWLLRKIIDILPFDMTREGRDWQAEKDAIEKLESEEERLQLWAKLQRALVLARLFGGSALIMGTADANTERPLNIERVGKAGLKYLHVMSRHQLTEGQPRLDPTDEWYGQPEFFEIRSANGQSVKIHPSRVIPFIGQRAPEGGFYGSASWYWGDPLVQSIGEAVKNADLAQSGFAMLIDRAAVDVFKFKDLMSIVGTADGEARIQTRVNWTAQARSASRAIIMDTEDEWEQVQATFAGIPEALMAFLQPACGAADVPVTRLLGLSPTGLQSTGDGEERDYQTMIAAKQKADLRPGLLRLDEVLIRSALGSKPDDVYFEFAPLRQMDEKDAAEIENKYADTFSKLSATGEVPSSALGKIIQNRMIESGRYPGSEAAFEEAEAAMEADPSLDPANENGADLTTREQRVSAMEQRGQVAANDALRLLTDAAPRSLYVSRKLLNADALIAWAKKQGLTTTLPAADMHVTVLYSRTAVDWMAMGSGWDQDSDGKLRVAPGGARILDRFGDATVLLFSSSALSWRHEDMVRNGASHDFNDYAPHVTLTYDAPADLDLSKVEPYRGELVFGPEIFAEVEEDWQQSIEEE